MTPTEADAELSRVGLIGQTGDSVNSDDVEVGRIASQSPSGGTTAKAGDTIVYHLSKGPETADVPYVIGWTQDEASAALREAGFDVVVNSEENDNYGIGVVFAQSVTGTANRGSEVVLTVSSGSSKAQVPSVVGQSEAEAINALENAGFSVVTSYESSEVFPAGYVISQSSTGSATKGTTIEIKISTGKESQSADSSSSSSSSSSTSSDSTQSTAENASTTA
jgi:serine/threonine-protein kinase